MNLDIKHLITEKNCIRGWRIVSIFYEIRPNDLRVIRNSKQIAFPAHMQGNIEILYVFSGLQCLEIDEIPYEIHEGEAAIIFSDTVHRYYKKGQSSTDALLIICNPRILGGVFPDFNNFQPTTPFIPKEDIHEEALCALKYIKKDDDFAVKLGWTYVIMSHFLRHIELKQRQRIPIQDMAKKIVAYIADNFTEPITLDSLAAEFCVSKNYISHIFSDRIKMNFRNYLGLIRTENAAKLLRTTDVALTTISINAGFDSQRTFNRVFYAIYGITPREFRNNINRYLK